MAQRRANIEGPLRVLQSYSGPGPQTNPYIIQLHDALGATPGVARRPFSWGAALLGNFDVFHAHWPEALIEQRGTLSTWARQALYALALTQMRVRRIPIVRTAHNVALPSGINRTERALLEWTDSLTRVRILLNEFTPVPAGSATELIEHGHYRDWFAEFNRPSPIPGRLLFFGKVRRYKNADGLLAAFRDLADDSLSLRIVGSPSSDELLETLQRAAGPDPRINLVMRFIEDAELVREAGEAQLIVLPYPEMHNSGSVLAALSLDRPVLVPDNDFNRALAKEVGEQWVVRFSGELSASSLRHGLEQTRHLSGHPDLSRRDWDSTGLRHLNAYRRALQNERG